MAWNRPNPVTKQQNCKTKRKTTYAVWGVFGFIGVAVCLAFLFLQDDNPNLTQSSKVQSQIGDKVEKAKQPYVTPERRKVEKTGEKVKDALNEVEAAAELVKIEKPKNLRYARSGKQVFSTCVEQMMCSLILVEPGDLPFPLPHLDEEDRQELVTALVSKNEIEEGDSERVTYAKESVDYLKKEMIKFIKDGGDPDDFLHYYHDQLRQASDTYEEVCSQYHDLQETDPDIAEDFLKKANKILEEKGIKTVQSDEESPAVDSPAT